MSTTPFPAAAPSPDAREEIGRGGAGRLATAAIIVLGGALALRSLGLGHERLWTDEVYSVTYAVQPLFDLLIAVLRFDAHLPLYYVQLHVWGLVSHSTLWFYLNSVGWSWVAVVVQWRCTRRFLSPNAGLLAALLFAAMPIGINWAHTLRMYGMLGCLTILAWFYCWKFFTENRFQRAGVMLSAILLVIAYSHAAGVLIIGYSGVYGLYLIKQYRPDRARIWWWIKMYLAIGFLAAPALVNVLLRDTNHLALPTLNRVASTLAGLVSGPAAEQPWACALAALIGILVIAGFLADARVRSMLVGFVVTPIVLGIVVSYVLQPIWADRLLFFTVPFLAIAAAQGLIIVGRAVGDRTGPLSRQVTVGCAAGILAAGLAAASVWAAESDLKPANYRAAARMIQADLRPGDVIFIPEFEAFWGVAWYLIGPDWGSPLAVQDTAPASLSEKWNRILDRLGPVWRARLHLAPRTRMLSHDGAVMVIGLSIPQVVADARRVWLVNIANNRHPYLELPGFAQREREEFRALTVQLLTRGPAP